MANTLSLMTNALRNAVSKQRIRYTENGYNLDLAYICENIIAMGYPAENIEGYYRNRIDDVYQFFEGNHRDHYKIYNLCSERNYDINKFHCRVGVYPFDDHNPPTIELIRNFCDDVDSWLKADEKNVAAVHCKAGKGRTGTMICCYLLHSGFAKTAQAALAHYDEKRTYDKKGVTIPSQRRYVDYYSNIISSGRPYERRTVQICEIRFSSPISIHSQGTVHCTISNLQDPSRSDRPNHTFIIDFRKSQTIEIDDRCIPLTGDVKVEVYHKLIGKREKYFHFWFNTYFLSGDTAACIGDDDEIKLIYELSKSELDHAHKDNEHKIFPEDFKVQLVFKPVPSRASGGVYQTTNIVSNSNNHNNSSSHNSSNLVVLRDHHQQQINFNNHNNSNKIQNNQQQFQPPFNSRSSSGLVLQTVAAAGQRTANRGPTSNDMHFSAPPGGLVNVLGGTASVGDGGLVQSPPSNQSHRHHHQQVNANHRVSAPMDYHLDHPVQQRHSDGAMQQQQQQQQQQQHQRHSHHQLERPRQQNVLPAYQQQQPQPQNYCFFRNDDNNFGQNNPSGCQSQPPHNMEQHTPSVSPHVSRCNSSTSATSSSTSSSSSNSEASSVIGEDWESDEEDSSSPNSCMKIGRYRLLSEHDVVIV